MNVTARVVQNELSKIHKQNMDAKQAMRMAMNEAVRKGKTEIKRSITDLYNIKASKVTDSNKNKGLSLKLATNKNLRAEVDAGHIPINVSNFKIKDLKVESSRDFAFASNVKSKKTKTVKLAKVFRNAGVEVEIKKGEKKVLATAFRIEKFGNAVFARGKKQKLGFAFAKPRMPIDSISTISIATAAQNINAQQKYWPVVEAYYKQRLDYHLNRMIK